MPPGDGVGQADFRRHLAHLVLEEFAQRLDELHVHLFRQAAHIVVALDHGAWPLVRDGLDDVRVQRALRQPFDLAAFGAYVPRLFVKDFNERMPDDFALAFGVFHAFEQLEKAILRPDKGQVEIEVFPKVVHHFLAFPGPQHAVINKHAVQALAYGLVQQHGHDGGVHPAGQGADHMPVPNLLPRFAQYPLHKGRHGPVRRQTGDAEEEIAQNAVAVFAVVHFRMELHCVDAPVFVGHGGNVQRGCGTDDREAGRRGLHGVPVRHPDPRGAGAIQPVPQGRSGGEGEVGRPVLARARLFECAAQGERQRLHPVTDAKNGRPEIQQALVQRGSVRFAHAGRPARKNDSRRFQRPP